MNKTIEDLKERVKQFSLSSPLMEGREKGAMPDLFDKPITLRDYDFIDTGSERPYAVLVFDEDPGKFYFGGLVITEQLKQLNNEGYHDLVSDSGLKMKLSDKKSRNGKTTYTFVEYL